MQFKRIVRFALITYSTVLLIPSTPSIRAEESRPVEVLAGKDFEVDGSGFFLTAGALWLRREDTERIVLADDFGSASPRNRISVLTTDSVDYDYQPGLEIRGGQRVGNFALELGFFGLHEWSESASRSSSSLTRLRSPALHTTTVFPRGGVDRLRANFSSDLNSLEVNLRRRLVNLNGELLAGFRFLRLDDEIVLRGETSPEFVQTDLRGLNHMAGGQIGGRYDLDWNLLTVSFIAKAGLLANLNEQSIVETSNATDPILFDLAGSATGLATTVEAEIALAVRLGDHATINGGYRLVHLAGVTTAAGQVALLGDAASSNSPLPNFAGGTNDGSTLLFHGFHVGMSLIW